jgi:hypothetical protein
MTVVLKSLLQNVDVGRRVSDIHGVAHVLMDVVNIAKCDFLRIPVAARSKA